jgi:hypothetical protein
VRHVKREINIAAHGLAEEAARKSMDKVWLEEVPQCIVDIVNLDLLCRALALLLLMNDVRNLKKELNICLIVFFFFLKEKYHIYKNDVFKLLFLQYIYIYIYIYIYLKKQCQE